MFFAGVEVCQSKSGLATGWRFVGPSFRIAFPVRSLVRRQELDADLITGQAHHSTAAICQTCRRQKQEEFLEVQSFERPSTHKPRACLRHVEHHAVPAPGSINPHDVNTDAAFKIDALALSVSKGHCAIRTLLNSIRCSLRSPDAIRFFRNTSRDPLHSGTGLSMFAAAWPRAFRRAALRVWRRDHRTADELSAFCTIAIHRITGGRHCPRKFLLHRPGAAAATKTRQSPRMLSKLQRSVNFLRMDDTYQNYRRTICD